jgi:hypothetical protein
VKPQTAAYLEKARELLDQPRRFSAFIFMSLPGAPLI